MRGIFHYGLKNETFLGKIFFILMHCILVWAILGLVYVSNTKHDLICNAIQILCYLLYMLSLYHRMETYNKLHNL